MKMVRIKARLMLARGLIYCHYDTLKNKAGKVIGVIVIGRHISELHQHITEISHIMLLRIVATIFLLGRNLFISVNPWFTMNHNILNHLTLLKKGDIPDEPLEASTNDEMGKLAMGINLLADSLREKGMLRK